MTARALKNKKALVFLGLSAMILTIAGVVAFNTDLAIFNNLFGVASYEAEYVETFESPENWQPCQEIPKTVIVTNKSNTNMAVRISYDEYWRAKDGTTELPLQKDGVTLAVIIFQNESDWELKDGWYYYKNELAPGESTSSLFKAVKLDCAANFAGTNVCTQTETGMTCVKPENEYEGAKYHLFITVQTIQADGKTSWINDNEPYVADCDSNILYDKIACQTNGLDSDVDFTVASAKATGNGNGVNTFAEKANEHFPVYYFRGEVDNNNVIWGGFCWKALRTTTTGGVKLIYSGIPSGGQCNATYDNSPIIINDSKYIRYSAGPSYNDGYSPADVGYMYGDRIIISQVSTLNYLSSVAISSNVIRNGDEYTLSGDIVYGKWSTLQSAIDNGHRYFCWDNNRTTCDGNTLGYVLAHTNTSASYLKMSGYDNIEAAKNAMYSNVNDSTIKSTIESWFEDTSLASREDDLEDTVFCNDRGFYFGSLVSESSNTTTTNNMWYSYHSAYGRSYGAGAGARPYLDCDNINDAFTKDDEVNGNGKLKHKVATITSDEYNLAGYPYRVSGQNNVKKNYLYSLGSVWTMTPALFDWNVGSMFQVRDTVMDYGFALGSGMEVHPVVSLKAGTRYTAGGNGTSTAPYVIE